MNWHIDFARSFKPGDPPPSGYLDWHEWARVQHKAGLRQKQCRECGLWRYPQETCCGDCEAARSAPGGRHPASRCLRT